MCQVSEWAGVSGTSFLGIKIRKARIMMGTVPIRLEKTPERKELCGKSRIGPVSCFQFPDHG